MNTNYKVIGLTQFGIKPKSTAPEADGPTPRSKDAIYRGLGAIATKVRVLCMLNLGFN